MKKLFKFCVLFHVIQFSSICNGQQASGTITFQTNTPNTTIQAKATSLFANGVHEYDISGNTNTAIPFGPYELDKTAGVENFFNTDKNHVVLNNGSNFLNAYVTAKDANALIYNINGQVVGRPLVTQVSDDIIQTKMNMSHLSNGVYIVRVNDVTGTKGFKFLKTNNQGFSGDRINAVSQLAKTASKTASKTTNEPNYNISWDGSQEDIAGQISTTQPGNKKITLEEITNNNVNIPLTTSSYYTGDVAISAKLNGTPTKNIQITMKNVAVPDSTYTKTITDFNTATRTFKNIYVQDATSPNQYEITIVDNQADGTFLETKEIVDIYHDDAREINGTKVINLTALPDFQNITYHTYNSETRELESGVTLIAKSPTDGTVYDTEETVNGNATLTIPENTEYRLEISKAGFLTKTNARKTTVEDVTTQSLMNTSFNTTAIPIQYYDNTANEIATDTLKMYQPPAQYTDFILGKARIHYPNRTDGTQFYEDIFDDVATLMGIPGAFIKSDTAFGTPTQEQIDNYDPRPQTRNTYDGQIGVDITSYTGGSTGRIEKTLDNGNQITISTNSFRLGGLDIPSAHHEIGNLIGTPLQNGNTTTFKTSRNTNKALNVRIQDSKQDRNIMPFWINMGRLQYFYTDSNNIELEQSRIYSLNK